MTESSTMYNRRLTKSELGAWLRMEQTALSIHRGTWTDDYTRSFFELPSTLLYLATINGEGIGGTAVYHDAVHSVFSLVSAIIRPQLKEKVLSQMVRSSLPFFRSATIRQVEVLVSTAAKQAPIRFPLAYTLEQGLNAKLEIMGFAKVGTAWQCSVRLSKRSSAKSTVGPWDANPNVDGARRLLLEQTEGGGLTCPQIWLALDLAVSRGTLKTVTIKGRTQLACGFEAHGDDAFISFLSLDSEMMNMVAAASRLLDLAARAMIKTIHLPLVGKAELGCVEALGNLTGSYSECDSMNLMVKVL